jgi:outer membrane biosynthesis protein TonB
MFPDDTLASWLARGVVWTVCVELLLLALAPLEAAIWETRGGERLMRRARVADARLRSGSRRRTMLRLTTIAAAALAIPAALLAAGLSERAPAKAAVRPVKVVEVTRVVRPVTVKRVKRVVAPASPAPVASDAEPTTFAAPPAAPVKSAVPRPQPKRMRPEPEPVRPPAQEREPQPEVEQPADPAPGTEDAEAPPAATGSRV